MRILGALVFIFGFVVTVGLWLAGESYVPGLWAQISGLALRLGAVESWQMRQ